MITGVVLARNEEGNIAECLRRFRPYVSELILIDMDSSDRTVELARPFVDRILSHQLVANFDAARNVAIEVANNDWLWFLDADERITPKVGEAISRLVQERGHEIVAITIPFKTYFCGQWMQHCGWWPGYTMPRVLKRGHFRFVERLHGGVDYSGPEIRLPPDPEFAIDHFSYSSVAHYVEKFNRYTSTEAQNIAAAERDLDWRKPIHEMVRDLWQYYERHHGARDGYRGWVLSWLAGQYRWFARTKLIDSPDLAPRVEAATVPLSLDEVLDEARAELHRCRGTTNVATSIRIHIRTPLFDYSGYAEDGRSIVKSLALTDTPFSLEELRWSDTKCRLAASESSLLRTLLRLAPGIPRVTITNCIPGSPFAEPDPQATVNILRTTFETDRIPDYWLNHLAKFDEIWVVSQHNARAFCRSGIAPERIRVVPGYVDTQVFSPSGAPLSLPTAVQGRFVFLSIFDWQLRKGWDVLLRAFCEEFSGNDSAGLILKCSSSHGYSRDTIQSQLADFLTSIGHRIEDHPEIVLWDVSLEQAELAALYRSVDAFVLPSRGEGWGRPYIEAMSCGLPVIGTTGSGNDDFMNESNSFIVSAVLTPVPDQAAREIPVYLGHEWLEPNLAQVRSAMRCVFENRNEARQVGSRASAHIERLFSLAAGAPVIEAYCRAAQQYYTPENVPPVSPDQLHVRLEGEFFAGHSFSNVNEQIARQLLMHSDIGLSIDRKLNAPTHDSAVPHARYLNPYFDRPAHCDPQVVIRHMFPPNWRKPNCGTKWIHIQPWEFGWLPIDWLKPLRDEVDEIWCPSQYVKDVYVRSGIPASKIHVIPWGIDPKTYHPSVTPIFLPTPAPFRFLFMGGTVARKGIDLVLQAYCEEFVDEEAVCLVVKDVGTNSFYRYGNRRDEIVRHATEQRRPHILYSDQELTDGQRASLIAACDCVVAPYRGEGFCLPVLEALACGVTAIVPQGGPTDDFLDAADGFAVPAQVVECSHEWRLRGPPSEFQIEIPVLRRAMREAFEHRDQTKAKGRQAAERVLGQFTWEHSVTKMVNRIRSLVHPNQAQAPVHDVGVTTEPLFPAQLDVSLCIVTYNCEAVIAETLARVAPFVREVIVVDMESTDRTPTIAAEYGARVFLGPPADNLAAVLNVALEKATSEWILYLTPGERIGETSIKGIRSLLEGPTSEDVAFAVTIHTNRALPSGPITLTEPRLFRNHSQLTFGGFAYPTIQEALARLHGSITPSNLEVRSPHLLDHRFSDFRRLHLSLQNSPADIDAWIRLGIAHMLEGNWFHAECYFTECLPRITSLARVVQFQVLNWLTECYTHIGDPIRAHECRSRLANMESSST